MTFTVTADPAHCQNWAHDGEHITTGLSLADLALVWLIFRGARIPFRVSREASS